MNQKKNIQKKKKKAREEKEVNESQRSSME